MTSIKATVADVVKAVDLRLKGSALRNRLGGPGSALLAMAMLLAAVPMSLPELVLGVVGVVAYLALHLSKADQRKKHKTSTKKVEDDTSGARTPTRKPRPPQGRRQEARPPPTSKQDYKQPSVMPVQAPSFSKEGWEAEVSELIEQISPTKDGDELMRRLVRIVKQAIWPLIPEAEVTGFASGNPKKCRAFGVAVPDVDIVVDVSPEVLTKRLEQRMSRNGSVIRLDARKLQKCAIRSCTDQLVTAGGFKFRRSAFRGQEPKVTLMVPASLGLSNEPIPVDFSVNTATPLHNAALLTECGQIELRARELILLVHRWARDRGICHAAKGHLPPYAWSLLCIYFLQVGVESEGQLLPALDGFTTSSGLVEGSKRAAGAEGKWAPQGENIGPRTSVASLFSMFMRFYTTSFDWRSEAVSVRVGRRAPPALSLPLHVALSEDGYKTEVAPSIEDPFEPTRNLGTHLTAQGILRLREELERAEQLCSEGASLSVLLEPWAPPERETLAPRELQQGSEGESEEGSK